jgi:hypothetical protein
MIVRADCGATPLTVEARYKSCRTMKSRWVEDSSGRWGTHNAKFVGILFANGPFAWADNVTFWPEDESEGSIVFLSRPTQEGELPHKVETVGSPRAGQEDKVEELHALKSQAKEIKKGVK